VERTGPAARTPAEARKAAESASGAVEEWSGGKQRSLRGQRVEPDPVTDRYPINATELARKLRVNAKSLRALLRLHKLVPGQLGDKEYRISQAVETAIWRHPDVQTLPRR
jgi:hypothetical protein